MEASTADNLRIRRSNEYWLDTARTLSLVDTVEYLGPLGVCRSSNVLVGVCFLGVGGLRWAQRAQDKSCARRTFNADRRRTLSPPKQQAAGRQQQSTAASSSSSGSTTTLHTTTVYCRAQRAHLSSKDVCCSSNSSCSCIQYYTHAQMKRQQQQRQQYKPRLPLRA